MNQYLTNIDPKKKHGLERVMDALSLGAVLQYCAYRFLQSTMFNFYYSNTYKLITMGLLLIFGGTRYLYVLSKKWSEKDNKERKGFLLNLAFVWLLALPFFYVGWKHDYKFLIFLPTCCMCLYDMDAGKVCRWFFIIISICLAALILCCLSGSVRNIVVQWKNTGAFGTVNSTDFASYFSFLFITAWCGMRSQKWQHSIILLLIVTGITYVVWKYTNSTTLVYTSVLLSIFIIWDIVYENILKKNKKMNMLGMGLNWLSILAFPLIGVLVIYLSARFALEDSWVIEIERGLSGRLATILLPYEKYGINAFGAVLTTAHGNGATSIYSGWSSGYTYLDVAYAMMAIKFGWIITAIIISLFVWMTVKALRSGCVRNALAMVVLAVHAFSEARILDINYNIFLVMPFCMINSCAVNHKREKTEYIPFFVALAMGGGAYWLLPTILSWLRTFFYLKRWNQGIDAMKSFLFCMSVIVLVVLLWKSLTLLLLKKKRVLSVITILVLLLFGFVYVNNSIETGRREEKERIKTEKQVVKKIQDVASLSVYAAEAEELYRREDIDIAKHLFSSEELGREKGSIIVDRDVENYATILSGGQYTQISEWSGLYSYDPDLINSLNEYEWRSFYTGKRTINLRDMAIFNDLPAKDTLTISNGARVETRNNVIDQIQGNYRVQFKLSGLETKIDKAEIVLEVIGEAGERTILQEEITNEDFDAEGKCSYEISYFIEDTPEVTFAITVSKETKIKIEEISWWKES